MDFAFIAEWSIKIAQEVAPKEVYKARFLVNEFIRGGRDRKRLFKQIKGSEVGGSGLGEITIFFSYVLQALAVAGPLIYRILSDGAITNGIDLLKEAKELYENFKEKRPEKSDQAQIEQLHFLIHEVQQSMVKTMAASGVEKEELQDKSYRILLVLFEKPDDAARFIQILRGDMREMGFYYTIVGTVQVGSWEAAKA